MNRMKEIFVDGQRIVIKIGTNLLADRAKGINIERIDSIGRSVSSLQARGKQVAIVTSGAIGAGMLLLGMKDRPRAIPEKQAAAAIGQPILMEWYENAFRKHRCTIAQKSSLRKTISSTGHATTTRRTRFPPCLKRGSFRSLMRTIPLPWRRSSSATTTTFRALSPISSVRIAHHPKRH